MCDGTRYGLDVVDARATGYRRRQWSCYRTRHRQRSLPRQSRLTGHVDFIGRHGSDPHGGPEYRRAYSHRLSWPAVFVALAVFALVILLALTRLPESAPPPETDRLTMTKILQSFSLMLSNPTYLGYQIAGSFSFAALFCYLSTVAYFLPDVFDIPTALFGYAFALTVFGFMTGSLINAKIVMRYGMDQTLKAGLLVSLASAACIAAMAPYAGEYVYTLGMLSSLFFLGVGLTAANASMGAISLFPQLAGSASAVYGFTHALLASGVGVVSRQALRRPTTRARADYAGLRGAGPIGVITHAASFSSRLGRIILRFALNHHATYNQGRRSHNSAGDGYGRTDGNPDKPRMNTLQSSKPSAWVSEPFGLTNSNASTRVFMRPIGLDMAEVGSSIKLPYNVAGKTIPH